MKSVKILLSVALAVVGVVAMAQDFSWKISAKKYLDIYQKITG